MGAPVSRASRPLMKRDGTRRRKNPSCRTTRRPLATSAPAWIAATSLGMSLGWVWRSPSIVTTIRPRARAMPACMAGCCPKLRLKETTRTRGSRSCSSSRSAIVPSVDPSSMKITSAAMPESASVRSIPSHSLGTVACSFRSGITIVTSGACSRLSTVCGAASVAMAKAYRFVRTGTCACAPRAGPDVIMPPDARLPDRPLGSAHGGVCNRGLRRHRDRFRAQLPAVALPRRARVAGTTRRHAGAAAALRAVRHPRHRARLRLRPRAAGQVRRRALASEMLLLVVLGLAPLRHGWRSQRRNVIVLSLALGTGLLAMLLLWRVYSQLQPKYGVGQGGAVVDLGSSEFWRRIGDAWTGSSYVIVWVALAAAALAGLVMLAMRDRRAALILGVWLVQPIVLLSILTATSPDFAPERHLSFMIPAYVAALATFLVEVGRRAGRYGPWLAALLTLAAIMPGVVALSRDV